MNTHILKEKRENWDNKINLKNYITRLKRVGYIDCSSGWDYEYWYILENLEKIQLLQQYIESIDDRNSIKLQTVKDDMKKILKKEKNSENKKSK